MEAINYIEIAMAVWLLVMSIVDIRNRQLPLYLILVGNIFWISCLFVEFDATLNISNRLLGLLPGFVLIAIAFFTGKAGYGDGITVMILGLNLGIRKCVFCVFIALLIMSLCSGIMLAIRKVNRNTQVPFIPFIMAGWLACKLIT